MPDPAWSAKKIMGPLPDIIHIFGLAAVRDPKIQRQLQRMLAYLEVMQILNQSEEQIRQKIRSGEIPS